MEPWDGDSTTKKESGVGSPQAKARRLLSTRDGRLAYLVGDILDVLSIKEDPMAEEKAGKVSGWIKAVVTSIMGLCSGAVLMSAPPVVNNPIKPAKPLANFGQQVQGLTVTFQNRSTGGGDGW